MKFENEKHKEEFACNPVGKARIIANTLTNDSKLQNKLLQIFTESLTSEQINKIYNERIN
jgi:hypothetical protein